MIKLGNDDVVDIRSGSIPVEKVYQGTNLVWTRTRIAGRDWDFQQGFTDLVSDILIESVCWGGDKWCAIGHDGCFTSPDGVTWTFQEDFRNKINASDSPYNVGIMLSITWKENMLGGPCFCAVGWDMTLTSPDGVTWTRHPRYPAIYLWEEVIWYGGRPDDNPADEDYSFMVLGDQSNFLRGNPQGGLDWYYGEPGSTDLWKAIGIVPLYTAAYAYDPSTRSQTIVVIGGNNTVINACATSNNFLNWTESPNLSQVMGRDKQYKVIWAGNQFVSVGSSNSCATSPDGVIWTRQRDLDYVIRNAFQQISVPITDIVWTGSELCAVGWRGVCATSPDGVTWKARKDLQNAIISSDGYEDSYGNWLWVKSIAWNGNQYCAVGTFQLDTGSSFCVTSP